MSRIIGIIDSQGAGIGRTIIKQLIKNSSNDIIVAMGTNAIATENMLEVGARYGVTGPDDICTKIENTNFYCIIGPIGIIATGGIMGSITTSISATVFSADCIKYIIPLQKHGIFIPGTRNMSIKECIDEIMKDLYG